MTIWQEKASEFKLPYKKYQALEVLWLDAAGGEDGWEQVEDFKPIDDKQLIARSVGIYWGQTEQSIIILQSHFIEEEDQQIDRTLQIPKVCILQIKKLKEEL